MTGTETPDPDWRDSFGYALIDAVKEGNIKSAGELIAKGANVNVKDPRTGGTALHYAAAYSARHCLATLIRYGKCDYLIRDARGLLPSEVADEIGGDLQIAKILARKEAQQAAQTGESPWIRPADGPWKAPGA